MYPFKAYNSVVGEDTFAYVAVYYKFRLSAVTAGVCNKRRVNLYEFDGDICCVTGALLLWEHVWTKANYMSFINTRSAI